MNLSNLLVNPIGFAIIDHPLIYSPYLWTIHTAYVNTYLQDQYVYKYAIDSFRKGSSNMENY